MLDESALKSAIDDLKSNFPQHWKEEKYKWVAVKWFQDNWNIEATDFSEMFKKATDKVDNLLASNMFYPRDAIINWSKKDPEFFRNLFKNLYDETKDLHSRVKYFIDSAAKYHAKLSDGGINHYQNTNAISVYLWLRYPDKYYIYKYSEAREVARTLKYPEVPKKSVDPTEMLKVFEMYDEIRDVIKSDAELINLVNASLTDNCYSDPELVTLTFDVGFYISRKDQLIEKNDVMFKNDIKEFLLQCIKAKNIIITGSNKMPSGEFKTIKGKYKGLNYITSFGQGSLTYSPWLVFEAYNQKVSKGIYPCLLFNAQDNMDNLEVSYGVSVTENSDTPWDNSYIAGLSHSKIKKFYTSFVMSAHSINEDKDIDNNLDNIINDLNIIIENFKGQFEGKALSTTLLNRIINALETTGKQPLSFSEIYEKIKDTFGANAKTPIKSIQREIEVNSSDYKSYEGKKDIFYKSIVDDGIKIGLRIWQEKNKMSNFSKNQILYGPPGTGKTYNTIIHSVAIIEDKDISAVAAENYDDVYNRFRSYRNGKQIDFITFHQSYSYEEFVEGIKPQISEWGLIEGDDVKYTGKDGIFKIICKNARQIRTDKTSSKIDFTKARIFKMSLGAIGDGEDIYNYCLNNNVVALGWGYDKDFSKCNVTSDFKAIDDTWGAKAVEIFKNWMRIGDIILISNGNSNIKAIAQITGNYEYHNDTEIKYCQFREVKWLYNGEDIPVSKFYDKKLSQQAIYAFYSSKKEGKADYNSTINTNVLNEIITGNINSIEEQPYVLIIDEINRGNISKIFGELITLIEEDKREKLYVQLPYSQESFTVPKNLYIIGTMNTADRSIAAIDIALRRRFKFVEVMPNSDLVKDITIEGINLKQLMDGLNRRISVLIDRDHQIGHAYFMHINTLGELKDAWFNKILPLLNEYFYGDWNKLKFIVKTFINEENVPEDLKEEYGDEKLYSFKCEMAETDDEFILDLKGLFTK